MQRSKLLSEFSFQVYLLFLMDFVLWCFDVFRGATFWAFLTVKSRYLKMKMFWFGVFLCLKRKAVLSYPLRFSCVMRALNFCEENFQSLAASILSDWMLSWRNVAWGKRQRMRTGQVMFCNGKIALTAGTFNIRYSNQPFYYWMFLSGRFHIYALVYETTW